MKDFKLISEAEDSYHIEHKNGRKFTIEKKGLSKKAHEEIQKLACGGSVQKMAEGGVPEALAPTPTPEQVAPQETPQSVVPAALTPTPAPATVQSLPLSNDGMTSRAQVDPLIQNKIEKGSQLSKQEQDIAKYAGQIGQSGSQINKATQELSNYQPKTPEEITKEFEQKDNNLMQAYMNKSIDPNRFMKNMSTGSKIMAGIAMALSGAGAGRNGQNLALGYIQKAIDNDIMAQKEDQGKALNLWKMNREKYKDEIQATMATQNQLLTAVQAKIALAGANTQNADARMKASEVINQLEQQKIANRLRLGLLSQNAGGGVRSSNPADLLEGLNAPPEHLKKAIDEVAASQNTAQNAGKIVEAFDNAAKGINAVDFVPGMQNADQKQLHALLGPTFQDVEGTVRQAAMDNTFNNITPQFGDSKDTISKKRDALIAYMKSKEAAPTFRMLTGVPLNSFKSTNISSEPTMGGVPTAYYEFAKANPNDPVSKAFMKKMGMNGK